MAQTFGGDTANERGTQWGATVMSEQIADMAKMGSHTARFGATTALWYEVTHDAAARDRAARSLAWATYTCSGDGIVAVGEDHNEGWWFSDGYGDYIRHFLFAMGAVPEWAPANEEHLLRSTSIVTHVAYEPAKVAWSTFDEDATETLRLTAPPSEVTSAGVPLSERVDLDDEGYVVEPLPVGVVLRVRHHERGEVAVAIPEASEPPGNREAPAGAAVTNGCASGPAPGGTALAGWGLGALTVLLARRRRRRG